MGLGLANPNPNPNPHQGLHGYLRMRPNEWEQKAYQLLVMRYLIGLGDELAPLRYRLLPTAQFINIEYYEERQRQRLPVDGMVRGHRGYLIARPPNPNPTLPPNPDPKPDPGPNPYPDH